MFLEKVKMSPETIDNDHERRHHRMNGAFMYLYCLLRCIASGQGKAYDADIGNLNK